MAQLLNYPFQTAKYNELSPLSSLHSNFKHPVILKKKALSITFQRPTALPVLCSVGGNGVGVDADEGEETTVPSTVVLGRSSFPKGFTFGAASSAYQVEGAWNEGGKGPSIWDTFTHQQPAKIKDKRNGDVATDSYHRYKEDIKIMKKMGVDAYRFSISWSRVLPDGTLKGGVNKEGIAYYNNLINELLKNGIEPYVTIFHWDVPQALEDKYGGFLDRQIVDDFKDYANLCFKEFGNRVKRWITVNEPWSFCTLGYSIGYHAPGRCTKKLGCPAGNSLTEPYIVGHNLILAHAAAARLYKERYMALQKGEVGITLISQWFKPYSDSFDDKAAAERAIDFMLGWFMDPIVNGDYPFIMRAIVRDRLPYFTKEESDMIKGSYDFIGLNYYTSSYARTQMSKSTAQISDNDDYVEKPTEKDGVPIGKLEGTFVYVVPVGIKDLLVYTKKRYNNPKIYITENGTEQMDNGNLTPKQVRSDKDRIDYIALHLAQVRLATREGVNVKGYFVWSLMDNFEWEQGYTERFGLTYIDYKNGLKRSPKASTKWFTRFLGS